MAPGADMRVLVATIGKPFGVRGEVTVRLRTDEPEERLAVGESLWVVAGRKQPEIPESQVRIESSRISGPGAVLRLSGVGTREQAEALRGTELWADVDAERRADGSDEWYDHQLVGLPCVSPSGEPLGEVVEVAHHPAHDSLVVRTPDGDRFVPLVRAIVPEISADKIVVDDPGGLLGEGPDPAN